MPQAPMKCSQRMNKPMPNQKLQQIDRETKEYHWDEHHSYNMLTEFICLQNNQTEIMKPRMILTFILHARNNPFS